MRRSEFNALIERNDQIGMHAIGRALVHLFNRQTADEQQSNDTGTTTTVVSPAQTLVAAPSLPGIT